MGSPGLPPTTIIPSPGYGEDTPHVSGDSGTMVLAVRKDSTGTLADTNGDYAPLQVDADGRLKVDALISGASGGTAMVDDSAFTPGSTFVTPVAGTYRTSRDNLDDNDAGAVALTQKRGQLVTLETSGGTEIGTSSNPVRTDPTGTTTQPVSVSSIIPGTGATNLGKAEDSPAATGDVGVVMLAQRHDAYTSTVSANEDYSTLHVNSVGQLKTIDNAITSGDQVSALYDPNTGRTATVERVDPTGGEGGLYVYIIPNYTVPTPVDAAVTSIVPGTAAANLGKAEDAAHTTGATGVMALGVRNDADTALAGTTGDYIPFGTDAVGRVQVNSIGKLAHDAADTSANSPHKVGGAAVTNNDALTSVASGDVSNFSTDRKSRQIVDSDRWQVASATNATTTDAALIAAPGAGLKLQVYGLFVSLTCPVQTLNIIKDEGVRFRFASGTYHFNVVKTVHHVHTILNAPDSVAFPLEPTMINLQHGHWDGGDNEALNFSLMGLSGAALGTAYVTAYYRVMPT